ncbi:MAG: AlpA family transcriptional regulator, partial [Cellvibrionales bacterium]|nr:AlpA family transcriptional regulator [Cellvibrionales bacterium]
KTGLSRSTIYERMDEGTFPKQIQLGLRAVGWLESEVEDWLEALVSKRDQQEGNT